MSRRLTKEEARQVRSLVEDGGYTKAEARELVLAGAGEPQPAQCTHPLHDEYRFCVTCGERVS